MAQNIKSEFRLQVESLILQGKGVNEIIEQTGYGNYQPHVLRNKIYHWGSTLRQPAVSPLILTAATRETWQDGIPEGEPETLTVKKINGVGKLAILSDIHFPYHDREALLCALQYLRKFQPDTIILNGDIADFYPVNRFMVRPGKPSLKFEFEVCRAFFKQLRYLFPNSNIYFKDGNHEARLMHFIYRNAAALDGVVDFAKLMDFQVYGINYVANNKFIKVGKLKIAHGHEVYSGAGAINVAKVILDRALDNIIVGHFHRTQEDFRKNLEGDIIGAWTTGCLQNLTVDYMPVNRWNHGFACAEFDKSGVFEMHNKKIINGKVL